HAVLATRINDALTLVWRHRHRLLTPDMLLRARGSYGELSMNMVRRHDVNHVDVGIVYQLGHVVVAVNVLVLDAILRLPRGYLARCPRDDAHEPTVLGQ